MISKILCSKLKLVPAQVFLKRFFRCCSKTIPNYKYELIKRGDFDKVLRHLEANAFRVDPLLKAAGINKSAEGKQFFKKEMLNTLCKGLSLMALNEKNKIAGVVVNNVLRPCDFVKDIQNFNMFSDVKLKKLLYLVHTLNSKADLFNCFGVDQLLEIKILSVDPIYVDKGLRKILLKKTEELAHRCGFQLIKADTSNICYQKMLKSSRYRSISEIFFIDYIDKEGEPAINVDLPHRKFKIMYRTLEA